MHKSFEELCALAATGQITGDAMFVLDRHVKECGVCRTFLQDMVSLKAHVAPVVAGSHARTLEKFRPRNRAPKIWIDSPLLSPLPQRAFEGN